MYESRNDLVVTCLFIIFSSLGFLSSVTILVLIKAMKKWNGYLAIIWSVEVCQLFYDASFSLYNIDVWAVESLWTGLQFFGGLSASIWTNVLSFVVLYVVFRMSSFDILGHYYLFAALALVPAVLFLVLHIVYRDDESASVTLFNLYYYLRFGSIAFNFATFLVIAYRARLIKSEGQQQASRSPVEVAISVLSQRMIYYPLMQAATVLPASLYESLYGIHQSDPTNNSQFAVDCIFAITAPSAGIGYLVIFLVMQPNAYKHFRTFFLRCKNYSEEESSVAVSGSRSHLTSSAILHQGKSTVVSINTSVDVHSPYHHQSGAHDESGTSAQLRLDRMRYMEEEELLSEIDSASGRSGRDRDSSASIGSRLGSPFWRTRSQSASIDSVL